MIMEVAVVWLLCAAVFLELADRAPVIDEAGLGIDSGARHMGGDEPESVAAEALSLKTAMSEHASS